jgi:WD40 repeat protein
MFLIERQLTTLPKGHCLHNTQVFSDDDTLIVYDTRNDDSQIQTTGSVEMLNVRTGEEILVYQVPYQSKYGPGAGAASFSPTRKSIMFLRGLLNCNQQQPYGFNRRSGVKINIDQLNVAVNLDARNIAEPLTPGALRGGTHAHQWSGDSNWISYTYNDYLLDELSKQQPDQKFNRAVGIMIPDYTVEVTNTDGFENFSGSMFAFLISQIKTDARPNTDEIFAAVDECWIGTNGYQTANGTWQRKAIAFQGCLYDASGKEKREVYVVDLPEQFSHEELRQTVGSLTSPPLVPTSVHQRRLTYTPHGICGPRHWLRSSADGRLIAFLSYDDNHTVQIFGVSPQGGQPYQISKLTADVSGPFNISPEGKYIACLSDNNVWLINIRSGDAEQATFHHQIDRAVGSVIWNNKGDQLAYNRYVKHTDGNAYLQIFLLEFGDK